MVDDIWGVAPKSEYIDMGIKPLKVEKRDGSYVDFDSSKIEKAISACMKESVIDYTGNVAKEVTDAIVEDITKCAPYNNITIDYIQDLVEENLMKLGHFNLAKLYIIYRNKQDETRYIQPVKFKLLTDSFISKYKKIGNPMGQLGSFVYYRTYSRWIPAENRREYWWETARRSVEYNCSLDPNVTKAEAEELFDNVFFLRQFLSGRTLWTGGTGTTDKHNLSNFNCSLILMHTIQAFKDLFYLLLLGCGVGVNIQKAIVAKLPKFRANYTLSHSRYNPVPKDVRSDYTSVAFKYNNTAEIIIGDSKEGWVDAYGLFLDIVTKKQYDNITNIIMNYDNIRGKGERIVTFGGLASGHEALLKMIDKVSDIIQQAIPFGYGQLTPLNVADIANITGENVASGGVRRTAEMIVFDEADTDVLNAKSKLYIPQPDGTWLIDKTIAHRQMSNNSIKYEEKPTREALHSHFEKMRYSGEPGFINGKALVARWPHAKGLNPCGEALLDDLGLCNLTTVNVLAFVENGVLNTPKLLRAQELSARAGVRMTLLELELPHWDAVQKQHRLLGCSITGWQDAVNASGMTIGDEEKVMTNMRDTAVAAANDYADKLHINRSALITILKPEGTLSQLPAVSSGIHFSHAPFYIRRVRINAHDALVKVCEELGYTIHPEVGQTMENCHTKVVEFPIKAPAGKCKKDVFAIEQLELYKRTQNFYVNHNTSITIHVRDDEWGAAEQWVWDNWDDVLAISFISFDDTFYSLLPYEEISEEMYNIRIKEMKPFTPHLLTKYELADNEKELDNSECASGACPIR